MVPKSSVAYQQNHRNIKNPKRCRWQRHAKILNNPIKLKRLRSLKVAPSPVFGCTFSGGLPEHSYVKWCQKHFTSQDQTWRCLEQPDSLIRSKHVYPQTTKFTTNILSKAGLGKLHSGLHFVSFCTGIASIASLAHIAQVTCTVKQKGRLLSLFF